MSESFFHSIWVFLGGKPLNMGIHGTRDRVTSMKIDMTQLYKVVKFLTKRSELLKFNSSVTNQLLIHPTQRIVLQYGASLMNNPFIMGIF